MSDFDLVLENLIFQYPSYPGLSDEPIIKGLSLKVQRGEFCLILGVPDSGKTTLSRLMMGLLPRYSGGEKEGRVLIGGEDVDAIDHELLIRRAGLLFQDPQEQILTTRCDSETVFSLESLGTNRSVMWNKMDRALGWMELSGFERRDPNTLSGGEQKRVLLSSVRAQNPDIWILDETLEELDNGIRKTILDTLLDEGRTVVLFASKYLPLFDACKPTTYLLKEGVLEQLSSPGMEERLIAEGLGYRSGGLKKSNVSINSDADDQTKFDNGEAQGVNMPSQAFLTIQGLTFGYEDTAFQLHIPELTIQAGERIAVVGSNGSGKSTLAKLICGLLEPAEGTVVFNGPDVSGDSAEGRKAMTSYLFQNPDYQLFLPTVNEELLYGRRKKEAKYRALEALEKFHLPSGEAPPALLSFGMRKRLQGAIAYMQPRPLLILDEGDSGLSYGDFVDIFNTLVREEVTVILITHSRDLAQNLCDRILIMEEGRIREGGTE